MRVNEIFCSLQGEGRYAGTAAVFVRFSGCNLRCPFCDTQHDHGTEMTEEEIVAEVRRHKAHIVVFTGGEPAMQLTRSLVGKVHRLRKRVHVETNGTLPLPAGVDWITLSPKSAYVDAADVVLTRADEVKVVYDGIHDPERQLSALRSPLSTLLYLQPLDTGDAVRNRAVAASAAEYVGMHPQWCLSLQIHKILNIR